MMEQRRIRMEEREWIRLDNASSIFLAARNDIDTKVFRLSAEMSEPVNHEILQAALNNTYEDYPLFHSVLRRGYFWYYLEKSDVNPRVKLETEPPVSPIYESGERNFLFRILYHEHQIHIEVFHALTDGTGALWFFEDLISEYVRLRYFTEEGAFQTTKREKENLEDSFNRYFREREEQQGFTRFIRPLRTFYNEQMSNGKFFPRPVENQVDEKVYQVKGTYTTDHRPRIIHANLPLQEILTLAKNEKVTLTIYLTALYVLAVYMTSEEKNKETTISVSVPINLRQFFPSFTVRNFFSTTKVTYTFQAEEEPDLSAICQELSQQFSDKIEKDALESRLRKLIEFEFNPAARVIPRPLKDLILKGINKWNNRKITVAMSNLGIVRLPEMIEDYVEHFYFSTSVVRPQFCMISYKDHLNLSFISPFTETSIVEWFIRYLTDKGLNITIDANKVTREELGEDD